MYCIYLGSKIKWVSMYHIETWRHLSIDEVYEPFGSRVLQDVGVRVKLRLSIGVRVSVVRV